MAAEPPITEPAPAKVNLTLHVTGRREDGYHLLESAVVFPAIGDRITATTDNTLRLDYAGRFADALPEPKKNLVFQAASALAETYAPSQGAHLILEKNLPVASGIGGGSADAAAALRALARLWGIDPTDPRVTQIAAGLGADVPVCLLARPSMMTGIGETLAALPALPQMAMVLVNPGIQMATPDVFKARDGAFSAVAGWPDATPAPGDLIDAAAARRNDLEAPAIALAPEIDDILASLAATPGIRLARMSGSGATCFGLTETLAEAEAAAGHIRRSRPDWWVEAANL